MNSKEAIKRIERLKKYEGNPIIRPQGKYAGDCIFNPGAIVYNGRIGLLCRCINLENKCTDNNWSVSTLVWAWSDDGINFELDDEPVLAPDKDSIYKGGFEDPRLVYMEEEDLYVLTYTGVKNDRVFPGMIAFSKDLYNWELGGEVFPSRAVVIVSQKINGKYWAYYDNSTIKIAWSEDLRNWQTEKEAVVECRKGFFDETLCEAAGNIIITDNGLLLVYNGASNGEYMKKYFEGFPCYRQKSVEAMYSTGWVLFDKNNPEKVIARSDEPFLKPEYGYEIYGLVEYTVFSEGLVEFNGKYHLYFGCADTSIGVAIEDFEM